jgi:hypothetical protein
VKHSNSRTSTVHIPHFPGMGIKLINRVALLMALTTSRRKAEFDTAHGNHVVWTGALKRKEYDVNLRIWISQSPQNLVPSRQIETAITRHKAVRCIHA